MRYIIYARKSTESEDRQSISIQSQIFEMQEIATRDHLHVVKIFQESKSAKEPGRPVFDEMMKFIKSGKADAILCWKIDRLARNPVDEGFVKWLLQKETIKRIRTFDREYNPDDNVVIASVEFSMANQYIRDLSKNVKRGLAEKVRLGEYPGPKPIGYMTDYRTKKMIPDPDVAPFIVRAYDLYISENVATDRVADILYEEGFRSRLGNKVGKSTIYRILTNPVYAGLFRWKEQIHSGIHEPIVSIATFEEAEKRLAPKKWQTRHDKRSFNYRGFLVCGECGLKVTAEVQKGHVYYRCTKSKGVHRCSQPYTREEELEKQIRKALKRIRFDDEYLDLIVDASKEKLKEKERAAAETEDRLLHTLGDVRKRKKSLVDKFIADSISKDVYDERYSELTMEEANLEERIGNVRIAGTDAGKEIEEAVRFVKTAHDLFNRSAPEARRELIETLSSNIGIKDRKVAYFSLNDPFSWLEEDVNVLKAQRSAFERAQEPSFAFTKTKTEACASDRSIKLGR